MSSRNNKRNLKPQRGAALLEMAVLMPLLIIVLFGFVELGRALMQANTLTKAVTTGVRFVARVPNAVTGPPHCNPFVNGIGAWNTAIAKAELLIERDSAGTGDVILPGLDTAGAITFTTRPELINLGSGNFVRACVVKVTASTPFVPMSGDSLVPFFQVGPIMLNAQAEERYIGE